MRAGSSVPCDERQLMPPPRLPRHLRPCRPLWSARQVRFASDQPGDAGGSVLRSGRSVRPAEGVTDSTYKRQEARTPALKIHRHLTTRRDERGAEGKAVEGASTLEELDAKTTPEQPDAGERSTAPQLRIHKKVVSQDSESYRGVISSYLGTKAALDRRQRPASTASEGELREKLRQLEEQLAVLQKKLGVEGGVVDAVDEDSAPPKTTPPPATPATDGQPAQPLKPSSPQQAPRHTPQPPPSLLDELFPEASSQAQPDTPDRRPPPKLDLPAPDVNPHIRLTPSDARSDREKAIDAFRARGETTTVLQLSNCSTALTEADFRRLVPRGLHIESWTRDGDFYRIIPGRDPLSLERLPFYYLLFHTPASALAYQKNAARLSKLTALHAPNGIHSAIPPPAGFLERGEDVAAITASFVLHPAGHALDLRTLMQPYNRALRALIDAGGYPPIVPARDPAGRPVHRVLMHIDGYEPSHWDLWQTLRRHAHARGIIWPFRNDHASALRRLRDTINLRTVASVKQQALASNPRAASSSTSTPSDTRDYEDPHISAFLASPDNPDDANSTSQLVMNRVYNRWIVEFDDEDAARRFATMWHRVPLPDRERKSGREGEEARWVRCEYLW